MKIYISALIILCCTFLGFSQVGINTENPDVSSILDLVSTDKGILFPRMTTIQKEAIENPSEGLIIYDTDKNCISFYNKSTSSWENLIPESTIIKEIENSNGGSKYNIFLVAGQSNTHYGLGLDPAIDTSDPDIFMVGRQGNLNNMIIPASEPLHHWTSSNDRIGFALTFAKLYKKNNLKLERKILLVPCGYSATNIAQWAKGGNLYTDAVTRTVTALSNNTGSVIKGILWHQGEYNIGTANYPQLLDEFIANLRNDFGNPEIPIVLGGMVPYWVNNLSTRRTQQENIKNTPSRIKKAAYADSEYPTVIAKPNNAYDDIHFDANGQRELGVRYYDAFISIP